MTEKQQKEHQAFIEWLYSLSIIDYGQICWQIQKQCHVNKNTLYKWKRGIAHPGWHCKRIINQLANRQIYNIND